MRYMLLNGSNKIAQLCFVTRLGVSASSQGRVPVTVDHLLPAIPTEPSTHALGKWGS